MSLQRACALCPVDRFTFKWSIRTYLLSFIHWLPMNQLPWRTIPSDKQSTDHGTGRWVFKSNIHDQTLLFYHLLYGLLFIICLLWTIIISVWVGTCIYLHVAVLCYTYLEWYHQLTSQTFTNFQSFNDQISIHVKYFQKVMKIFLHFQCTAFFMLWT